MGPRPKMTTVSHEVRLGKARARLAAPLNDHIEKQLRNGRFYEEDLLKHLQGLSLDGTYVDVGAHVGNHAIAFALMGARRVVAYEPQSELFALLGVNCVLNRLTLRVRPRRFVVHDTWEHAGVLATTPGNAGATRFGASGKQTHRVVRLDEDLARIQDVTLIKVDVEGVELPVLRSAARLIDDQRPVLVCEAHDDERLAQLAAWLEPRGYWTTGRAYGATPTYVWLPRAGRRAS